MSYEPVDKDWEFCADICRRLAAHLEENDAERGGFLMGVITSALMGNVGFVLGPDGIVAFNDGHRDGLAHGRRLVEAQKPPDPEEKPS